MPLDDGRVANRAFLFGPDGERIASYDKIHMFDVDLDNGESWRESRTYRPGETATTADLQFEGGAARLGFAVCYDMRFPHLFREEAMAEMAEFLGRRVHLFIFVKVRQKWGDDPERYRTWGLDYDA